MLGRIALVAVALVAAAVGAHSLSPRQLYSEMYPVEPVKREAFHICTDADPTFVRAVGADREACYSSMPHAMAVAMGRVKPGGALELEALTDPSREAELLMTLAAIPPRQPITAPRSFSNTAWMRAMQPPCAERQPAMAYAAAPVQGLPAPASRGRAVALSTAASNKLPLPAVPRSDGASPRDLPVLSMAPGQPTVPAGGGDSGAMTAFNSLPDPDIGDQDAPAIVPLAPVQGCGGV